MPIMIPTHFRVPCCRVFGLLVSMAQRSLSTGCRASHRVCSDVLQLLCEQLSPLTPPSLPTPSTPLGTGGNNATGTVAPHMQCVESARLSWMMSFAVYSFCLSATSGWQLYTREVAALSVGHCACSLRGCWLLIGGEGRGFTYACLWLIAVHETTHRSSCALHYTVGFMAISAHGHVCLVANVGIEVQSLDWNLLETCRACVF